MKNLGEYLASLNKCGYCGRIISGVICRNETGEMCEGEIHFEKEYWAQQMARELQERYDNEQWRLHAIEQGGE